MPLAPVPDGLVLDRVSKHFGATRAVDDVSLTATPGRLFGLLGPNGAGKTTTIRMVAGITRPDRGTILLGGVPVGRETQRRMGYLPEERGLYRKLRVGEQLVYLARLKGLEARAAEAAVRRWLARFDADAWYGRRTEELSKGMQQKVQFIATVVHEPALVILDEPFSGLDPLNADLLTEIIGELRAAGRTVLFASHRMEQVEQLCDDVCLLAGGRVMLAGTLREVKQRFGRDTVSLAFEGPPDWLAPLEAEGALRVLSRAEGQAEVRLLGGTPPRRLLEAALAGTPALDRFDVHAPSLAEIFRMAVGAAAGAPAEPPARTAS
ncbi:MAG: ABC transporter ATP-binding protein [Rubricoccaceae bacterium]